MRTFPAKISMLLALLFASVTMVHGQDPQYSQFYSNPLMLNPAFTGSGLGPRVAMNYRGQWVKIPGFYRQMAVSYDQPILFLGSVQGLGVNIQNDVAGAGNLSKTNMSFNYAYQVDLTDDHTLRFGLQAGMQIASIDPSKLTFPDQIDPRDGFVRPTDEPLLAGGFYRTRVNPDVGAGIAYFNEFAWLGFSVNHITEPQETFYNDSPFQSNIDPRLPRKYTLTGGVRIPIGGYRNREEVSITPAFLYKMQGQFNQIDAGLYLNVDPMVFGVWYRNRDALIGLIGLRQGPFSFGYSYDYTISNLSQNISGGSHELSVVLEFEQNYRLKRKHRRMPCPRF